MASSRWAGKRRLAGWLMAISALALPLCAQQDGTEQAPPVLAPAQASALPARLSAVEGGVRIAQSDSGAGAATAAAPASGLPTAAGLGPPPPPADELFHDAVLNMPLLAGMRLETSDSGRAELQFNDGSLVRLTPNSVVTIVSIAPGGEQLRAERGLSYYELPLQGAGVLSLQVGPDQLRLSADSLVRVDLDAVPFQVAALRGSAHVNDPASDVGFEVNAGETATLDPASATAYDVHQDVATNSWDNWNSDRDAMLGEMAVSETNARIGNGNPAAEGWNDLDYYGTWYNVPGAGLAWSPDGVDASFDPYGQGAWGYYAGVGYTWVSAYPWGWLPYRCGGWSYFNNFGWLWQPGRTCGLGGEGWYPYTGVHGGPRGYGLPLRPFDPRLRTRLSGVPLPRALPLATVARGPAFRFRTVGGARPEPRQFPVEKSVAAEGAPVYAATLPLMTLAPGQQYRQGYGFAGGGTSVGTGAGYAGGRAAYPGSGFEGEHINTRVGSGTGRSFTSPGPSVITPPPSVLPAPRNAIAPPPRLTPAPQPAPANHSTTPAAAAAAPRSR